MFWLYLFGPFWVVFFKLRVVLMGQIKVFNGPDKSWMLSNAIIKIFNNFLKPVLQNDGNNKLLLQKAIICTKKLTRFIENTWAKILWSESVRFISLKLCLHRICVYATFIRKKNSSAWLRQSTFISINNRIKVLTQIYLSLRKTNVLTIIINTKLAVEIFAQSCIIR